MLMKINENLTRQNTDTTKVAAAKREKKKTHDVPLTVTLEKKTTSKRKAPSASEKDKGIIIEDQQPEAAKNLRGKITNRPDR
jgi:ACT domain-containing protein